jgi:hypothetical protein
MARQSFVPARSDARSDTQDWRTGLARFGLAAKGVLYATLGLLALQLALGGGRGGDASQSGAMQTIQDQPFGDVLLAVLAAGLLAHGVWQFVIVFTGDPVEGGEWHKRVKYAAKAVIYLGFGGLAVALLAGGASSSGGSSGGGSSELTARLFDLPMGQWVVGAVGAVVVAVGIAELVRHSWRCTFMERINRTRDGDVRRLVRRAGRLGYAALGIVTMITGAFFVVAAVRHDPGASQDTAGSLQALADQPWGPWLLGGVAVGLILYGLFALAEARYRRAG